MFFFFEPPAPVQKNKFKPGMVCEIIKNDPRHLSMPLLYPDRLGQEVKIMEVAPDPPGWVWAQELKFGKKPTGVGLYRTEWLKILSPKKAAQVMRMIE